MIVMKFGGSSLQSAEAIGQAIAIIRSRLARHPIIVVSALGKVTDELLLLATEAAHGKRELALKRLATLEKYHHDIIVALMNGSSHERVWRFLNCHFSELKSILVAMMNCGHLAPAVQDTVLSFGERLSSAIVAMALDSFGIASVHLDARALVCTDGQHTHAVPLLSETYTQIREAVRHLPKGTVPVMGGFIGSGATGATTTLGRNSSNLSAVLAAAAVGAEEVEIWTDVDGVFRHDPVHVLDQEPIEILAFSEALEIARRGARVLHAEAVQLAFEENVSIHIRNTRRPELPGTRITGNASRIQRTDLYLGATSSD
ncbi:MAG TPA: aspartate kinase [Terriglobales bacterium]|nr:aspartate kinase [Terriglobales bacterium]